MSKRRSSRRSRADDKYQDIVDKLYELHEGGRPVVELFTEIPSSELYPDYRDIVVTPISMAEISKRCRLGAYENDEEFLGDFEQMVINAQLYNGSESPVVDDAYILYDYALEALGKPSSEQSRLRKQTRVLNELINYKYKGKLLAEPFMQLPPRKELPQYYQMIKNPTSFNDQLQKLKKTPYQDWNDFEANVGLIFSNAMTFNQEGSPLYSSARSLQRQLHNKIQKEQKFEHHPESSPAVKLKVKVKESEDDEAMSDDMPPLPSNRFDDDDDEDFQADLNDDDDEDEDMEVKEEEENYDYGASSKKQVLVRDEIVRRSENKGARDAMLQLVTCSSILHHSVLHTMRYGNREKPQIPPAYARDMVQVRVSASKKDAFTSFATTLPSYHHTLTLTVFLHEMLLTLPHSLTVVLNGRRLTPLPTISKSSTLKEEFELRLSPGLNQVTVAAIGPDSAGTVRPFGPPPIVGADQDEERLILWLNLSR